MTNPKARKQLQYRHRFDSHRSRQQEGREISVDDQEDEDEPNPDATICDFFDSEVYKEFAATHDLNPDDVFVNLYTDGFVLEKRGNRLYTMIHLIVSNYHPMLRFKSSYSIQLGIIPGPSKPKCQDSFLLSIVAELNYLATYGMVVKRFGSELCRLKVYLMMGLGDINAVYDMAKVGNHQSFQGCRICHTRGEHPDNRSHGMYFPNDENAALRTVQEFRTADPSLGYNGISIFSSLETFTGPFFWGADELHTICRGLGKQVYDLVTVALPTNNKRFLYTYPDQSLETTNYPF